MPSISGYSISELLFEGRRFRIYRGHDSEGAPVIIKVSASDFPSQEELELLNHEFEIGSRLKQADCIIPYLDFPETDHGRAIIMKDCGARSLDGFLKEENTGNNYNFAKKIYRIAESPRRTSVAWPNISTCRSGTNRPAPV